MMEIYVFICREAGRPWGIYRPGHGHYFTATQIRISTRTWSVNDTTAYIREHHGIDTQQVLGVTIRFSLVTRGMVKWRSADTLEVLPPIRMQ